MKTFPIFIILLTVFQLTQSRDIIRHLDTEGLSDEEKKELKQIVTEE
jgi:hypothetical protein